MIFYFSGTGNSAWVARQLAEGQNEELLSHSYGNRQEQSV